MSQGAPISQSGNPAARTRLPVVITAMPFGKYTLVARIGRGGMAEVYLGLASGPSGFIKPVVIKRILTDLESEPRLVQMFFDEARLAALINHPNVVQTYDIGTEDGIPYLAMEYLEGQTLYELLRRAKVDRFAVPVEIVARMIADALDGLHHAHDLRDFNGNDLGVVHRDISPQNIFITYDGVVKVLDFGIAKAATQIIETRTGAIKGKYAYMAPEQAKGTHVDRRADVWAIGVVLWESLAGRRLFKAENDFETLQRTLNGPIPRLLEEQPELPPAIDRFLGKALSRDRSSRYASAADAQADLERYLRSRLGPTGRTELGKFMQGVFADVVEEHRRFLGTCVDNTPVTPTTPSRSGARGVAEGEDFSSSLVTPAVALPDTEPSQSQVMRTVSRGEPRRARSLLFAGGAIGLVGATALAVALLVSDGSPAPTVEVVERAPRQAQPSIATLPAAPQQTVLQATPTPMVQDPPVPLKAVPLPTQREHGESATPERPDRPRNSDRDPAPSAPTTGTGFLTLDSVPWSLVSIDGRSVGTTPLIHVPLGSGEHRIVMHNPEQGLSAEGRVQITAGETTTRRFGLR